jgi:hypothetical protein
MNLWVPQKVGNLLTAEKRLGFEDGMFCGVTYMLNGSDNSGILEIKCGVATVNGHAVTQTVTDFHFSFPCQFLLHHLLHIH